MCLGHTDQVLSVTASPDGAAVVSGSYDKTLRIWEVADSRLGILVVCVFAHSNKCACRRVFDCLIDASCLSAGANAGAGVSAGQQILV